jgi:alpha-L-fucosidase
VTFLPERASLDARPLPPWYTDAKLGIFVHWGLYSIPAFAEAAQTGGDYPGFMAELTAGKDTRGRIPYAEWYLNALRVPGSATRRHHQATYGGDVSYFDLRARFDQAAQQVDLADWVRLFATAGARYVVMVTRHLDGYPLWPTGVANPHMPADYRSRRDLVGDLTQAVRDQGLRMGLYYAGGTDWTFTRRPIRTMADLMAQQALGPEYARYAHRAVDRADRYLPTVGPLERHGLAGRVRPPPAHGPLLRHRSRRGRQRPLDPGPDAHEPPGPRTIPAIHLPIPQGAGAGRPSAAPAVPAFHYDIQTHEYATPDPAPTRPWELCRGLGRSFGYNAQETAADILTGTQLVHLLADVIAHGGNLLINVGPDGTGHIPDLQQRPLHELGAWLDANGEAIYATRPWTPTATTTSTGDQVRFTHSKDTVYAIVLSDRLTDDLTIRGLTLPAGSRVGVLGGVADLAWTQAANDVRITPPPQPSSQHAQVLTITTP